MNHRCTFSVVGTVLLSAALATAQTSDQTASAAIGQGSADETPITLVGCIQKESDYREQHDIGRGGLLATGLGLGNEYVLINASRNGSTRADVDCSRAAGGDAYELTGEAERDLEPFVGRMVEIRGILKSADIDDDAPVGTTGTAQPSGGFDPLGQDLRLWEVNVMSFQEVTAQAEAEPSAEPAQPAPEPEPQEPAREEPEPVGTAGAAQQEPQPEADQPPAMERLPATASALPLTALLGLLSLAGAFGVRRIRR